MTKRLSLDFLRLIVLLLFFHPYLFAQSLSNELLSAQSWFSNTYHLDEVVSWDKVKRTEYQQMPSFILELKPEYNLVKIDNSPEDNIVDTSKIGGIRKLLILKFPTKYEAFWLIFSPTVNYFEAHSIAGLQDLDFDLNKLAVLNYSGSILIEHLDHEQPIHGYGFENGVLNRRINESDNFNGGQATERMCVDIYYMVQNITSSWVGYNDPHNPSSSGYVYQVTFQYYAFTYCWTDPSYIGNLIDMLDNGNDDNWMVDSPWMVYYIAWLLNSGQVNPTNNEPNPNEDPEPLNCDCQMNSHEEVPSFYNLFFVIGELMCTTKLYNINCNIPSFTGFISGQLMAPAGVATFTSSNEQVWIDDFEELDYPECGHWVRVKAEEDYVVELVAVGGGFFTKQQIKAADEFQLFLK